MICSCINFTDSDITQNISISKEIEEKSIVTIKPLLSILAHSNRVDALSQISIIKLLERFYNFKMYIDIYFAPIKPSEYKYAFNGSVSIRNDYIHIGLNPNPVVTLARWKTIILESNFEFGLIFVLLYSNIFIEIKFAKCAFFISFTRQGVVFYLSKIYLIEIFLSYIKIFKAIDFVMENTLTDISTKAEFSYVGRVIFRLNLGLLSKSLEHYESDIDVTVLSI